MLRSSPTAPESRLTLELPRPSATGTATSTGLAEGTEVIDYKP